MLRFTACVLVLGLFCFTSALASFSPEKPESGAPQIEWQEGKKFDLQQGAPTIILQPEKPIQATRKYLPSVRRLSLSEDQAITQGSTNADYIAPTSLNITVGQILLSADEGRARKVIAVQPLDSSRVTFGTAMPKLEEVYSELSFTTK